MYFFKLPSLDKEGCPLADGEIEPQTCMPAGTACSRTLWQTMLCGKAVRGQSLRPDKSGHLPSSQGRSLKRPP